MLAATSLTAADRPPYLAALKRGRGLADRGDFAGAIAAFRQALTSAPDDPVALSELGVAALQAGDLPLAEQSTRASVRLASEPRLKAASLYNLGRVCEKKGDTQAAVDAYQQSLTVRPNATVLRALAALDPAAAMPFDRFRPGPMAGPFATLASLLKHFADGHRPDALIDKQSRRAASPPPPYRDVRVLAMTTFASSVDDETYPYETLHLAVQLPSGWFVCEDADSVDNEGLSEERGRVSVKELSVADLLPGGAPEVGLRSINQTIVAELAPHEEPRILGYQDVTHLALVILGDNRAPSCVKGIAVESVPTRIGHFLDGEAREQKKVTLPLRFTSDSLVIASVPKGFPGGEELLGTHLLLVPR
jgi:hypothetical protein